MSRRQFPKPKDKGLFENGAWKCNCNPRLPAVSFQSRKGKKENKDRWFYTCQKGPSDPDKCDFFLWKEDAQPRELAALRNNSRTEPDRANETTPRLARKATPPPPYINQMKQPEEALVGANKRSRASNEEEEDEFGFDQTDTAFNNELGQVVDTAETPRKALRTDPHTTPRRRLNFDQDIGSNGLATPQTGPPFATRFAAPGGSLLTPVTGLQDRNSPAPTSSASPYDTPSRSRFKDMGTGVDLLQDVLDVLRDEKVHLNASADTGLRKALTKHAKIAEGHRRGRDVLRLELKAKEAKIAGLQGQLDTLKAELEANEAARRFQQWQDEQEDND